MPSSARKPDSGDNGATGIDKGATGGQQPVQGRATTEAKERARRASFDQVQPPQLQAQRMYPNHPLLAGTPPPMSWNGPGLNGIVRSPVDTFMNPMLATPTASTSFQPGLTSPVRWPGADLGASSSAMMHSESACPSSSYDYSMKKRACDQCNHSKVRCDFAHPCSTSLLGPRAGDRGQANPPLVRCSHRNVQCTYNKPPKSRTLPITPGLSYPMTAMPTGTSLSPVSHFSSPHSMGSPVTQLSYQAQMSQGQMMYPHSPLQAMSGGLPNSTAPPTQPVSQWTDGGIDLSGTGQVLPNLVDNGQALGMYMPPPPQQPAPVAGVAVPITQQYLGQLSNASGSNPSPSQAMLPTPSLTSHTTSPSSSDEPAERKSSLIGSMTALPLPTPLKSDSYNSSTPEHPTKGFTPPSNPEPLSHLPLQDPTAAISLYHWPSSAFTMDPRYQFRNPAALQQSDDEDGQNPNSSSASVFNEPEDAAIIMDARRRSSAGLWASAFNSMSLQDGSLPNSAATVPDPYTVVQVAQQIAQPRPHFPMAPLTETSEPSKMSSVSDVKDVWKLFMQDPQPGAGITPKQEKREGEVGMAMITPRPPLGRSLSKSNSMPNLTSPSLLANQLFLLNGTNGAAESLPQQANVADAQQTSGEADRQDWQKQIRQRQESFTMHPGAKFGRNSTDAGSNNLAMLPPPFHSRPVASIIQHSGALQQTLAPERAPSFGLTPNTEKPNPTNVTPPQSAVGGTFSRTPSKLSQRTTVTSATARPGNKRLPSQTLVPEAKKRSASFSVWDEGDDGALGDTEDDSQAHNAGGAQYSFPAPFSANGSGPGHSRSVSLGHNQAFDLSMFMNQPGLQQLPNLGGSSNYQGIATAPPGNWATTTAGLSDTKAV